MKTLSSRELEMLMNTRADYCISIYLPTYQAGKQVQQNVIRLKNLLAEVETRIAASLDEKETRTLLQPASDLLGQRKFWENQSHGLVIFLWKGKILFYRLPHAFEELGVVSNRFHLKPLLPLLSDDGLFYVLGLSLAGVKLFEGSRYTLSELTVPELPEDLGEALRYDDPEKQLQHQTPARTDGGDAAIYHGHGDDYDKKENITQYFNQVDAAIRKALAEKNAPMLIAGLDYLLPLYQDANKYPHLLKEGIKTNFHTLSTDELHQRAWKIIEPRFKAEQKEARSRYFQLSGDGQASSDLDEVISAAHFGRVDTLFVALGIQQWGRFDPERNKVQFDVDEIEAQDLLDLAAIQTISKGGVVYAVAPDEVPGGDKLAAIFRY